MKRCPQCAKDKEHSEFFKDSWTIDKLHGLCKSCVKQNHDKKYVKNKPVIVESKVCTHCKVQKASSEFSKSGHTPDGLQHWCKECTKRRAIERRGPLKRELRPPGMKECSQCKVMKPFEEFWKMASMKDGYRGACKSCGTAQCKRYYGNDREKTLGKLQAMRDTDPAYREKLCKITRKSILKVKYGLTQVQFDQMLEQQGGKCKICGTTEPGRWGTFYIDHCHETGKVRGLLCCRCNLSIGHMEDSPELLRKAAEYIEKSREDNT